MQPNCQSDVKCLFLVEPLILRIDSGHLLKSSPYLKLRLLKWFCLHHSLILSLFLHPRAVTANMRWTPADRRPIRSSTTTSVTPPTTTPGAGSRRESPEHRPINYTESESGEPEPCAPPPPLPPLPPLPPFPPQISSPTPQSQSQTGSLFRPKGSRTPTPSQQSSNPPSQQGTLYRPPSSLAPGSRAPIAGFSSFVW